MARHKIGERDTCARCDLEIEYIGRPKYWHDRGGNTLCPTKLRHWPGVELKHVPLEDTEECGQCGGYHPKGVQR